MKIPAKLNTPEMKTLIAVTGVLLLVNIAYHSKALGPTIQKILS